MNGFSASVIQVTIAVTLERILGSCRDVRWCSRSGQQRMRTAPQVIGEAQRQRNQREGGIGKTGSRKDGRTGDVEAGYAENLAIAIAYAGCGAFSHARGTDVVTGNRNDCAAQRLGGYAFDLVANAVRCRESLRDYAQASGEPVVIGIC